VCEFQFWQCRDSSCHVFLQILAVSRLHLIDPSSIEHKCLFVLFFVFGRKTVASNFSFIFRPKKIFSTFSGFTLSAENRNIIFGPPPEIGTVGNVAYNSTFAYSV